MRLNFSIILTCIMAFYTTVVNAAELIMVEQPGCVYCTRWNNELGPIYPKTEAGDFAPLRHIQLSDQDTSGIAFKSKIIFTPTFVLIEDNTELGRLEGYASQDFFWGLLEILLKQHTSFTGSTK